ncbi:MAG TPA: DUF1016 family protein [Desulfobacteraceae bacterium]|nr:DUF1016 family protein [Desulfobacteraceae bacterium]
MASEQLNFNDLVQQFKTIHDSLRKQAVKAVNMGLTLRNWMIGHYIYEYEQDGQDRAEYGEKLLQKLSDSLQHYGLKRVEERELRRFRLFYLTYPRIRESLTAELLPFLKNQLFVSKYQLELPDKKTNAAVSGRTDRRIDKEPLK